MKTTALEFRQWFVLMQNFSVKQVPVPVFSFKKAWHFKTEEDARQFIEQAKATGRRYDEDIEEGEEI